MAKHHTCILFALAASVVIASKPSVAADDARRPLVFSKVSVFDQDYFSRLWADHADQAHELVEGHYVVRTPDASFVGVLSVLDKDCKADFQDANIVMERCPGRLSLTFNGQTQVTEIPDSCLVKPIAATKPEDYQNFEQVRYDNIQHAFRIILDPNLPLGQCTLFLPIQVPRQPLASQP